MIVRSLRTKRAGVRGAEGVGVRFELDGVDGGKAGGVTGFGGDTIGVDGAGESGTVEVAGTDVGLCVASGV